MRNLILVDFKFRPGLKWSFLDVLKTDGTWDVRSRVTNTRFFHTRFGGMMRYLFYFFFPLKFVFVRKRYDVVMGWQQFFALNFAFWLRLLGLKSDNRIVVMTFIYKDKKGFIGRIYYRYIRYCLTCQNIAKVICHSSSEVSYYNRLFGQSEGLMQFVPLGIEPLDYAHDAKKGDYVFSTGRSNRDYPFLVKALGNTSFRLKIACEDDFETLSSNVEIVHDCYGDDMYSLMRDCFCVCIPLRDTEMSSGQLVVLQAMQFGKPVIVTRSNGVADYVIDGYNGFLIENDRDELLAKLDMLYNDSHLYERISANCVKLFEEKYRHASMARAILDLL